MIVRYESSSWQYIFSDQLGKTLPKTSANTPTAWTTTVTQPSFNVLNTITMSSKIHFLCILHLVSYFFLLQILEVYSITSTTTRSSSKNNPFQGHRTVRAQALPRASEASSKAVSKPAKCRSQKSAISSKCTCSVLDRQHESLQSIQPIRQEHSSSVHWQMLALNIQSRRWPSSSTTYPTATVVPLPPGARSVVSSEPTVPVTWRSTATVMEARLSIAIPTSMLSQTPYASFAIVSPWHLWSNLIRSRTSSQIWPIRIAVLSVRASVTERAFHMRWKPWRKHVLERLSILTQRMDIG